MKKIFNIWTVVILAFFLRIVHLDQSFWLDEAAQVIESSRALNQQFNLAADFHPPLYHLLLHFWLQPATSEVWVRMLSVFLGIGSIFFIYLLGRLIIKEKQALSAAFFLAISPYHIWYSQEARPYIAFAFFSLASTYFLIKKKWVLCTVFLVLSLYTHYFTLFLLIGDGFYIFLFEKKYLKTGLASIISALVLFSFWLPEFVKQLSLGTNGLFPGWTNVVSVSSLRTAGLTFAKFIFGRGTLENKYLYAVLIFPVFFLLILSLVKIWRIITGKILIFLFFMPFVICEFISLFIPIVAPQRLIFLLPLFYLILAEGIDNFSKKVQFAAILIVIITSIGGIYQYYTDPNVQREQWRDAVSFTEKDSDPQNVALFVFPQPFAPYMWYGKGTIDAWGIAPKFIVTDSDLKNLSLRLQNKKRAYLYQYLTGLTDPQGKTKNFLSAEGFIQSYTNNFSGVGFIYTYDKK
ncbi:glycosyltransferase family 39 protein [Candidatus Gottesmanbacteria bacterium]|nr:glycosyltransferase family 39 protein [Candidatus Gottesmanbacteria bacterium]